MSATFRLAGGLVAEGADFVARACDLLVRDGRIVDCIDPALPAPDYAPVSAQGRLVLPGLVNAHTHSHACLARGVADAWSLEMSLCNGPWMAGTRDPETMYQSTLLGAVEMLEHGITACYDLVYEFPRPSLEGLAAVARAYRDAGLRAVIAPMVADRSLFQAIPGLADALPPPLRDRAGGFALEGADAILATLRALVERGDWHRGRLEPALAPTIAMHCSDALLIGCRDLAAHHGIGLQMHVAESALQVVSAQRLYGTGMLEHLDALGLIGPRYTAAHGVWLDEGDYALLAARGASMVHLPLSNLRLGSGVADVPLALATGLNVGLATDGANSADRLDLLEVAKQATLVSRLLGRAPDEWIGAASALRMATSGSAACLGWGDAIGRLAPGLQADFVCLRLDDPGFVPANLPVNQLVTAVGGRAVADVAVAGEFVVRDGRATRVDGAALRRDADACAQALFAQTAALRGPAAELVAPVAAFARQAVAQAYRGPARMLRPGACA